MTRAVEGACGWEGWRPANSTSSGEDGVCGERLLTLWTRRQPSGRVEELAIFFFSIYSSPQPFMRDSINQLRATTYLMDWSIPYPWAN